MAVLVVARGRNKTLYERLFRAPEYYRYDPLSQEFFPYCL